MRVGVAQLLSPEGPWPEGLSDLVSLMARAATEKAELLAITLPNPTFFSLTAARDALAPLVREHGIALAAGPCLIPDTHGEPRPTGLLLAADGCLLGSRQEVHLAPSKAPENGPKAWSLGEACVGLLVGHDCAYPEIARILCLQGATILIRLGATAPRSEARLMADLWREVQADQVFGLEPVLVVGKQGIGLGAAIHAPLEMTQGFRGLLAWTMTTGPSTLLIADLDFARLRDVWRTYNVYRHFNPQLYKKQLLAESREVTEGTAPSLETVGVPPAFRPTRDPKVLALNLLLWWQSRPQRVSAFLRQRRYRPAPAPSGDRLRLGVAQTRLRLAASPEEYASHMADLVAQAVDGGAQLVVFPEYITLPLLGLLPGVMDLAQSRISLKEGLQRLAGRTEISPGDLFRAVGPAAWRLYVATFSALAAGFQVHILAGSAIVPDRTGRLWNVACLFGPDGRLIGQQAKAHLVADEENWGFARANRLAVFVTPLGKIASPVCMDHTYWETTRIVTQLGAEIIIDPSFDFDPAGYSWYKQSRGIWGRMQESPAYGVHCFLVGDLLDYHARGYSLVCAPLALTPAGDGILARAHTNDQEEVLLADIDLAALRRYKAGYQPIIPITYKGYLATAYDAPPHQV